jgi:hypothetical protein
MTIAALQGRRRNTDGTERAADELAGRDSLPPLRAPLRRRDEVRADVPSPLSRLTRGHS